jgi:hypothetical protein
MVFWTTQHSCTPGGGTNAYNSQKEGQWTFQDERHLNDWKEHLFSCVPVYLSFFSTAAISLH